ncbi:MAG: DNA translocase FtsK 4TM domain-containing protein, partial [Muribaculaceae bacterium]|nr:DNA translocase FtsK 4TM domain-containing protein [Muribaculaceae bacterium]
MSSYNPNEYDPSVVDSDDIYTHPERMGGRGRSPEPVQDLDSYLRSDTPRVHRNPDSQQDTKRTVPRQKVKKPKTEDDGPGFFKSIANFVTDRRTHGAIGIGLILFSAYVLIASLSYFVTGRHDQSAITSHSIEQLAANGGTENIGGPTGAVLSQVVLTNSLGLGAGVIIFYMTIIGLALLRVRKINFWSLTFKCLLIAITISLVAGLLTYPLENSFLYGGQHGRWINTLLIQRTGWIGAVFVSIFLVGCIVFIYLNELITLYMAYRRRVAEHKAKVEAARKAREEADAKVRENSTNDILNQDIEDVVIISHPEDPVVGFENANEEDHTDSQDPFEAEKPEIIDPDITERQPIRPYAGGKTLNDVYATTNPVPIQTQQTVEQGQYQLGESAAPQQFNTEEKLAEIPVVDTGKQSDENTVPQVEYQPQSEEPVFIENVTQEIETADSINRKPFDPTSELPEFKLPPIDILREYEDTRDNLEVDQESNEQKDEIIHALDTYGIKISKVEATVGATITLFEITPVEGTRVQTIKRLGDDLMMTLAAKGIRI